MTTDRADRLSAVITVNVGAVDHDLALDLPADATGGDLYVLLGSIDGLGGPAGLPPLLTNERTGRAVTHDESLLSSGLVTGDRLVAIVDRSDRADLADWTGAAARTARGDGLESGEGPGTPNGDAVTLRFLTGPRRHQQLAVSPGRSGMTIGRGADEGFGHPSVSRDHARLDLSADGVVITDLDATNGTTVNGVALETGRPIVVNPGDVVEVGDIGFVLTDLPPGRRRIDASPFHRRGAHLELQPAPRAADPRPPAAVSLPEPPQEPPARRFPIGSAVLPLVLGAVLAVVFTPIFAVFMAMSPLMVVWTFLDDRRSGRRMFAGQRSAFLTELDDQRLVAVDTADRLAAWHRRRTPTLGQVARWVRCGSSHLWDRRPRHDDFLTVAIGDLDRPSKLTVDVPDRGADELIAEARRVADSVAVERAAPVAVDLRTHPVVGLVGGPIVVDVARSIVAQLVGLRSPRHLEVVALAPGHRRDWEWVKWLPHATRPGAASVGGERLIAGDDDEVGVVFAELVARAERRAEASGARLGTGPDDDHTHTVVIIHPPLELSPAAVARFLELAVGGSMSIVFITSDRHGLPAECTLVVEASDAGDTIDVRDLSRGAADNGVTPWRTGTAEAMALARDLAPLIDVTVSDGDSEIPATVTLPELHDDPAVLFDVEAMVRRWASDAPGLVATLGADAEGPVVIDLQADGPHGLVAGTTGAGKSELLQTMIVDLAARHSPADLNIILIDYKGGSAFRACERLPHTVGFVTDLDDHLAARALTSLRAELRHRERLLAELDVSDLGAMRARYRHSVNADLVLPSLLIVIDEFAALRSEVPEFVDGLVDIAQRGRSLGVHMILATQKPGGVITPQIDANTNIRVGLRVASEADSRDLLGVVDAARIATDLPGRALLKIGGAAEVSPLQSAYVGGRSAATHDDVRGATVQPFGYGIKPIAPAVGAPAPDSGAGGPTDLERVVDTAVAAWGRSGRGRSIRRPWLPPLPDLLVLDSLVEAESVAGSASTDADTTGLPERPLAVAIGLADLPELQTQEPYLLDIGRAGNVAVYGTTGSGKTSLLTTIACSLSSPALSPGATSPPSGAPVIYGVDFGSGLRAIESLPTVADVVGGSERERLQLLITMLEAEVAERLQSGLRPGSTEGSRPPIVALVDGFGPFWDTLESFDFGRQADRFARLLSQGPSAGVHVVMTADQRSAIPFACLGSVGLRLVQRLASVDEYRALGVNAPVDPAAVPPGRTRAVEGPEFQAAVVDGDEPARLAAALIDRGVAASGRPVRALSDVVGLDDITRPAALSSVAVGLGPAHAEVTVDLADQPTFLVAGSAGSGRSTTLLTLGEQLASLVPDRRAFSPKRSSPLANSGAAYTEAVAGVEVASALLDLSAEIEQRAQSGYGQPMVVAVDDADSLFDDSRLSAALTTLVLSGRDAGAIVMMAASSFQAGTAYEMWIRAMRSNGHGLVLQPDGDKDEDLFDVRFPRGSALRFPAGRGYLVARSTVKAVQVARPATGPASPSDGNGRMVQ